MGAEEWRRTSLTVVGQQACSRWLHNTMAYDGSVAAVAAAGTMEWKNRRIGLVQVIGCISQL